MVGAGPPHSMRPYTPGYVLPVARLWHSALSSSPQSRQLPPGTEARMRFRFNFESSDAWCSRSFLHTCPASIGGNLPMACFTVLGGRFRFDRKSSIGPNLD